MDVLANHGIFQELQLVHDTGYFSAMPSLEENWQQVKRFNFSRGAFAGYARIADAFEMRGVNFFPFYPPPRPSSLDVRIRMGWKHQ